MGTIKEHSNQIVKILICLCLTFVFIFVQPKQNLQKAEALVPLLVPLGYLVAGVVAETMLEMGIKHVTSNGKTSKGTKGQKIADSVLGNLGDYDFDNTNPTRKADGSLEMNMSPNDRAKIARKIADEFGDVISDDEGRMLSSSKSGERVVVKVENYTTSVYDTRATEYLLKMNRVEFSTALGDTRTTATIYSIITGEFVASYKYLDKDNTYTWKVNGFIPVPASAGLITEYDDCFQVYSYKDPATTGGASIPQWCDPVTVNAYLTYLKAKQDTGADIHYGGGLAVPSTLKKVYSVGEDIADDYLLPNNQDLSNKPYKVKNIFPPSTSDEDVTWEIVQNHYDNDLTVKTKFEDEVGVYLENGDIKNTTNTYNTQTINNYYTDTTYPVKNDDIKTEIDIVIDNEDTVIVNPDTDVDIEADGFKYCVDKSSGKVVPCKDIEAIDGGLLAYLSNSYDYAVNAVKTSVNGLETIANGSVGLIALYSEIFDWLPDEVTVLLTSGLMLMIGLRVFRK